MEFKGLLYKSPIILLIRPAAASPPAWAIMLFFLLLPTCVFFSMDR
jgi:hypothetical protein